MKEYPGSPWKPPNRRKKSPADQVPLRNPVPLQRRRTEDCATEDCHTPRLPTSDRLGGHRLGAGVIDRGQEERDHTPSGAPGEEHLLRCEDAVVQQNAPKDRERGTWAAGSMAAR